MLSERYDSTVFRRLPSFPAARSRLASCRERLADLGAVLCRHRLEDALGITLVHQHFPLAPGERLVKEWTFDGAVARPRPEGATGLVVPYLWRYVPGGATPRFYPLEYLRVEDATDPAARRAQRLARSTAFLDELAACLTGLGLENCFGVSTCHGEVACDSGETLVETTDAPGRTLTIRRVPRDGYPAGVLTETNWVFENGREECRGICHLHCVQHCRIHCVAHCIEHN